MGGEQCDAKVCTFGEVAALAANAVEMYGCELQRRGQAALLSGRVVKCNNLNCTCMMLWTSPWAEEYTW